MHSCLRDSIDNQSRYSRNTKSFFNNIAKYFWGRSLNEEDTRNNMQKAKKRKEIKSQTEIIKHKNSLPGTLQVVKHIH